MNEVGSRIISDASTMKCQSRVAHLARRYSLHANIDGHRLHVQAVAGDSVTMTPEVFIRLWGAVTTEHLNVRIGTAQGRHQIVKEV